VKIDGDAVDLIGAIEQENPSELRKEQSASSNRKIRVWLGNYEPSSRSRYALKDPKSADTVADAWEGWYGPMNRFAHTG
jgi:hypothetical protein